MRLDSKRHEGDNACNHDGLVFVVARDGVEVSAWSTRKEANDAAAEALGAEAMEERARLPANSRASIRTTKLALEHKVASQVLWRVEYSVTQIRDVRGITAAPAKASFAIH